MFKVKVPAPFKTFYVVFGYVMVFALWWAYLLYAKNETAYKENIELNQIAFSKINPHEDYTLTADYVRIHSKYIRQKFMILGEGSAFIILLLFGLMRVRKVFLKEIELAGQQNNFILSITHELKSPLSTIKLSLQTLLKRKLEAEKSDKLIVNSLVDLDRLEELVDNILFAAKIERDEPGFTNDEILLSEIVLQAAERFSQNHKNILVKLNVKNDVYLNADALGFTSVINNLIENAIKYSEPRTEVTVELNYTPRAVILSVTDQGIGIAESDKAKIFEKFYRVGSEETRKTKGTGLGLYIVKRFVQIYHGTIEIEDNVPRGSRFILKFPKG